MKPTANSLAAGSVTFPGSSSVTPGAPPKIGSDIKSWFFDVGTALGFPSEVIWIIIGSAAFFFGRVMLVSIIRELRAQIESFKFLGQIDTVISRSRMPDIAWVRLPPVFDSPDLLRPTGEILAVGAGLVRLYRRQRTLQSTAFGILVPLAALALWGFGSLIYPFPWWFNAICVGVAWCPCGLLVLIWFRAGSLQMFKDRSESEQKALQDRY
jgi:hypothetical protein